jgi:hypothetical protein
MKMNSMKRTGQLCCILLTLCLLLLCGCASIDEGEEELGGSESGAPIGSEQGMLSYYQGKVQTLEQQLMQMDQQMEALKEEYLQNAQRMQGEIEVLRKQMGKDTETVTPEQEGDSTEAKPGDGATDTPREDATQMSGADYTYEQTDGGIVLQKYIGTDTAVVIPAAINGMRVVGMADHVFSGTAVQSVIVPQTVKDMGWFVFYGCNQLKSVVLPASVERIGYAAFDGCHKDLILTVEADSYAQKYAASFAMRYQTP